MTEVNPYKLLHPDYKMSNNVGLVHYAQGMESLLLTRCRALRCTASDQ